MLKSPQKRGQVFQPYPPELKIFFKILFISLSNLIFLTREIISCVCRGKRRKQETNDEWQQIVACLCSILLSRWNYVKKKMIERFLFTSAILFFVFVWIFFKNIFMQPKHRRSLLTIRFIIWGLFKKYRYLSCIYQNKKCTRNKTLIFFETFLKVSKVKPYLLRQKWTINKTLIFFKIWAVFKKYQKERCIYQDRN